MYTLSAVAAANDLYAYIQQQHTQPSRVAH